MGLCVLEREKSLGKITELKKKKVKQLYLVDNSGLSNSGLPCLPLLSSLF